MNKKIIFVLFLVLISFVNAETIKEETFASIGYGDELEIDGANEKQCKEIIFYDEFNKEEFTIISIHYSFMPKIKGNAKITVSLNNELLSEIESGPKEFKRIILKKEQLKEKNTLEICGFASDAIPNIKVLNDSIIGNYKTAYFPQGSLTKTVVSKELMIGKEIEIKTTLKNYGNEKTSVEIIDGDADREDIELIKGKSSFKGEIQPGQEISLEYTYKLKEERTRLLPSAKAYYLNEFGEKQEIESDYPEIFPSNYEKALEPIIMLKKQINLTGEKSEIEIVVINNSLTTIYNAELILGSSSELMFDDKKIVFETIQPQEIVYFKTKVKSDQEGEFPINCEMNFENQKTQCKETSIIFEENKIDQKLIIGSILAVIGIAIYSCLYFLR